MQTNLLSSAVVYIEGYQDTLYARQNYQSYRECKIYGTIDFIFGDATAVFQKCHIYTRNPLSHQKMTITAQGRESTRESTGFSIHGSYIEATHPAYLGRPWGDASRTVIMETYLNNKIASDGWLQWDDKPIQSTIYYAEYRNTGPGSKVDGRVNWAHTITDEAEANLFTVAEFIDGNSWLPETGVPYTPGLYYI